MVNNSLKIFESKIYLDATSVDIKIDLFLALNLFKAANLLFWDI